MQVSAGISRYQQTSANISKIGKIPHERSRNRRIANAEKDTTYLLAEVEIVATYKLPKLNLSKLENIFHRACGAAQPDLTIADRFGHPVKPRVWFLLPLHDIEEALEHIRHGSITEIVYDPMTARLIGLAGSN